MKRVNMASDSLEMFLKMMFNGIASKVPIGVISKLPKVTDILSDQNHCLSQTVVLVRQNACHFWKFGDDTKRHLGRYPIEHHFFK